MYAECLNNLIISVDDFGASEEVNRAILSLAERKKIDRAGMMMGGKISPEEVKRLLASGVKLDIHLHLLDQEFFAKRKGEPGREVMKRIGLFLVDFTSGRYNVKKVKLIWQKQIKDFYETFGRYPDGINSHEHVHFFPPLFRVALSLKEKFKIPYIRLGKEKMDGDFSRKISFILNQLRGANVRLNRVVFCPSEFAHNLPCELNTSDFLISFDWIKNKEEFFEKLPNPGQTELIFHPERKAEYGFLMENF